LVNRLSIKSKFLMMILGIAVLCIAVIGLQGLNYGKSSLNKSINDHLISIESAKKQQLEGYFKERQKLMQTFASQTTIINAMNEFSSGFSLLDTYKVDIDTKQSKKLENFYKEKFVKRLNQKSKESFSYTTFIPKSEVEKYLQYYYIVDNDLALDKKYLIESAKDNSYYTEVHRKFHNKLRDIVDNQGFDDLFLIDIHSLNVIYSVKKGVDFATNIKNGAYAHSSLAKVIKSVIKDPNKNVVQIADFKNYKPSYNRPQAFFAVPIYDDDNKLIGVLATQISISDIDNITTGNKNWEKDGLGKTGEVYIVGRDYKMRSDARASFTSTESNDTNKSTHIVINATVLKQKVKNEAVKRAIDLESGVVVTKNYLNKKVLTAYAPLDIDGLDWVIIADKEQKEANEPIIDFENALLISSTILATLITFYAIWLAYSFLAPVNKMSEALKNIISGKSKKKIELNRNDEFGELSNNIDKLIDTINEQDKQIEEKDKENGELLCNILPKPIAKRFKEGETHIAESIPNVAVLFSHLQGFDTLSHNLTPTESIELLNELIDGFDEKTKEFNIEKITTIGDSYMAASGLVISRLDYARRIVDFALSMFEVVDEFNTRHNTKLSLSIGIDSGEIMAGIVGKYKFVYDVWGEVVNDASHISHEAHIGTLRVSKAVFVQLTNKESYQKCEGGSEETYFISPLSSKD